jgi:hypothetical protein
MIGSVMRFETFTQPRSTESGRWGSRSGRTLAVLASLALLLVAAPGAFAAQERMPPDGFGADGCDWRSGLCDWNNLVEDPDGPGTDWETATNKQTSHVGHFTFATPTQPLTTGGSFQEFRAVVRQAAQCGSVTPTARIELWQSGAPVDAGSDVGVTALNSCTQGTDCQVLSFFWNEDQVASAANVEIKVFGTAASSGGQKCAVDLGAVEWNADVTAVGATTPTLWNPSSAPFEDIDTGQARLGADVDTNGGGTISEYGTVWGTAPGPTGNVDVRNTDNPATPFSFNHIVTIAELPGTLIYFAGYADNEAVPPRGYSPDGSFYLEPNQADSVTISNITDVGMRISWTVPANAGDGVIVVMKQGGAVDQDPLDSIAHVADDSFGTGAAEILASGNYVVWRDIHGAGSQVDVIGLSPLTTYAVAVYTYAGTAAPSINYQQTTPQTASDSTIDQPTLSTPTAPFANIGTGNATLGATIDDDSGGVVGDYGTVWGTATLPTGNDTPAAGTSPGDIPPVFPFSSGRTITETPGTLIYYRGYADNEAGRGFSPEETLYLEPNQAASVTISNVTSGGMRISWTLPGTGPGDGVIVVMKQGATTDEDPVDGTAPSAPAPPRSPPAATTWSSATPRAPRWTWTAWRRPRSTPSRSTPTPAPPLLHALGTDGALCDDRHGQRDAGSHHRRRQRC